VKGKVTWLPYKGEESVAIKELEEVLHTNLTQGTLDVLHRNLHRAIEALPRGKAEEILFASQAGATATVLDTVWDAATPELIGRQLCVVVQKDAATIKIPKAATATPQWITGGVEIPISEETYSFIEVSAKKSGVRCAISRDLIEDATWDIVARQLAEGSRAMAAFESSYIISQLIANAGNTATASNAGTLAWGDIADMIGVMWGVNRKPDVLAVNPSEFADLLRDSAIQNLILYGKQDDFVPGGPIAYVPGLKILVSSHVTAGTALLVDSSHAGVLFIRRDITMEDYEDPIEDLQGAVFTERWNFVVVDGDTIGIITNA